MARNYTTPIRARFIVLRNSNLKSYILQVFQEILFINIPRFFQVEKRLSLTTRKKPISQLGHRFLPSEIARGTILMVLFRS